MVSLLREQTKHQCGTTDHNVAPTGGYTKHTGSFVKYFAKKFNLNLTKILYLTSRLQHIQRTEENT